MVSTLIVAIYSLFLDDVDLLMMIRNNQKLTALKHQKELVSEQLEETRASLHKLKTTAGLERYAREKKLFKKDEEDIFVISYE